MTEIKPSLPPLPAGMEYLHIALPVLTSGIDPEVAAMAAGEAAKRALADRTQRRHGAAVSEEGRRITDMSGAPLRGKVVVDGRTIPVVDGHLRFDLAALQAILDIHKDDPA